MRDITASPGYTGIIVRKSALYLFLQRFVYGHVKLFGSRLNPIGCAVAYRTARRCLGVLAVRKIRLS